MRNSFGMLNIFSVIGYVWDHEFVLLVCLFYFVSDLYNGMNECCTDVMCAGKNLYNNEHVAIKLVIKLSCHACVIFYV